MTRGGGQGDLHFFHALTPPLSSFLLRPISVTKRGVELRHEIVTERGREQGRERGGWVNILGLTLKVRVEWKKEDKTLTF